MKHIHLDLHVNMHVIGTVIVSSLTVVSIAALEYVHLNSALAYEKKVIYAQFEDNNTSNNIKIAEKSEKIAQAKQDTWKMWAYSDEVHLNSAEELSDETIKEKAKMKKAFKKVLQSDKNSNFIKKVDTLSVEQKLLILERIEMKILELESQELKNEKSDKRLWHLLAAKELFSEQ